MTIDGQTTKVLSNNFQSTTIIFTKNSDYITIRNINA